MQSYLNLDKQVRNVKSQVDNSPPRSYSHITDKAGGKAYLMMRLRQEEIARDNGHLIEHLYEINRKQTHVPSHSQQGMKSLNYHKRKKELAKINVENKAILRALQRTKSVYRYEDLLRFQQNTDELRQRLAVNRQKDPRRPLITSAIAQSVQSLEAAVSGQSWRHRAPSRSRARPKSSISHSEAGRLKGRRASAEENYSMRTSVPMANLY
jgi:hypothetical protein